MNLPFQAVLFDLDGTLLDSLADMAGAMNRTLERFGFPSHPLDAYRIFVGEGARVLATRALPEDARTPEGVDRTLQAYLEAYGQSWHLESAPYPGIPEMLSALQDRGIRLAVLSNKPHAFTVACVSHYFAEYPFDVVLGQRPEFPRKPDPTVALQIAGQMDVPPDQILYVGDTAIDMHTAVAAGMYPLGVVWGFRRADELRAAGALRLIERPVEILHLVDAYARP